MENPLILLFIVAAIGYFVGNISIFGSKLGVAAVLFVGLAFGATNSDFNVPQIIFEFGLVLFVYSIGLSSGPAFFKSFKNNGSRDLVFVLLMLTLSVVVAVLIYYIFAFDASTTAGLYAGSTTNTPALAGVIDLINQSKLADKETLIEHLAVGYTYSYPMGVIGVMAAIVLMEKVFKVDYTEEKSILKKRYNIDEEIGSMSILITNPAVENYQLRDLKRQFNWNVVFGRILDIDGQYSLPNWDTILRLDQKILIVGTEEELAKAIQFLGEESEEKISHDRTDFDSRRIFVSDPRVVGRKLSELSLEQKFSAIITRIRRGDTDMLADSNIVLEQGDRIRFVAKRKDLKALSTFFGDSYYESSKVNIFSFGLGIAIGLLIGTIEFTLPGGVSLKLGYAGGPLLVSLILGAIYRTGSMVWTLPYSVNITLRQIGLTLLLAVIGLRSGNTFVQSLSSGGGLYLFGAGVIMSTLTACMSLAIGYKLFKLPYSLLMGFMSNQPAILDFAITRSKNTIPMIGYTIMFPIALIMKIVYAQLLYLFLQ